jgi:hypothetical protein
MQNGRIKVFREETDEIGDILLHQPVLIKHNLPVEDLGTTLPPKEDHVFDLKPLPNDLNILILTTRRYILLLSVLNFQERKKKGY